MSELATLYEDVVPPAVIRVLRRQALVAPLAPRMFWYPLAARPRTLFEQVIRRLWELMPNRETLVGAEWWSRRPATDLGLQFHFDRDEAIRDRLVTPTVSSVLYLAASGGPTLVMDAPATSRAMPKSGVAVPPRPGRCLVFPGALLHAVLPGPKSRWPRISMPVNWWSFEPEFPARQLPRSLLSTSPLVAERTLVRNAKREKTPKRFSSLDLMSRPDWQIVMERSHPRKREGR